MKRKNDSLKHQFPVNVVSVVSSGPQSVLVSCQDGVIYELDLSGRVAPLFDRMPRSAKRCRAGLAVEGVERRNLIPLFLARMEKSETLLILNGSTKFHEAYVNVCLVDLHDERQPIVSRINTPEIFSVENPFFIFDDERIALPHTGLLILNAQDPSSYQVCEVIFENAPPLILNCLKPHVGGQVVSAGYGEVNTSRYRRYGVSMSGDTLAFELQHESVIEARGCLWAVAPSPSGKVAFALVMREECMVRLPDGPKGSPVAELGEVVRVDAKGKTKSIPIFGDLALDFGVRQFAAGNPYRVPKSLYRVYPKPGPRDTQPTLCPRSDNVALYPTPGGTILEIDFTRQRVRELFQVGFPVQTLLLLGPDGPLAIAGTEGQFWLTDLEPRGKHSSKL